MKNYDVQEIRIDAPADRVYELVAQPSLLPRWTEAFASVEGNSAVLRTPHGEVEIELQVVASAEHGTVDWRMLFPDGTEELAHSRVVPSPDAGCVFTFVLAPSAPILAQLEGGLEDQKTTLARELVHLKELVEDGATSQV